MVSKDFANVYGMDSLCQTKLKGLLMERRFLVVKKQVSDGNTCFKIIF